MNDSNCILSKKGGHNLGGRSGSMYLCIFFSVSLVKEKHNNLP